MQKPCFAWWRIFNAFVLMCAVAFHTINGQNNTRKCDIKGFVPVGSLNGVVGSAFSFIKSLIGRTGKIWSVIYFNENFIYTSETVAYTIRECAIVRNVLHIISTFLFISWSLGAANVKCTLRFCHYSLNSIKVNCVLISAENLSKSQHSNSSISPYLDWNVSSLSITYSVVIFSLLYLFGVFD